MDEVFEELNGTHFGGALPRPSFSTSKFAGYFASYAPVVHYALDLRTGDRQQAHGLPFVDLANEIGANLGLASVEPGTDAVITWPQSVRPKDYPASR